MHQPANRSKFVGPPTTGKARFATVDSLMDGAAGKAKPSIAGLHGWSATRCVVRGIAAHDPTICVNLGAMHWGTCS